MNAILAALSLLAGFTSAQEGVWTGDVSLLVAGKALNDRDWRPTDRQGELGIQSNFQRRDWPVAIAADLLVAESERTISANGFVRQRSRTSELDLGVRKLWRVGQGGIVRPYVGGGLALASGELEFFTPFASISDRDTGAGLWLGGGVLWTLSRAFNLGLDAKLSGADVRIFDDHKNAGGFHLGGVVGWHWGG
jgi:hypothetical protein